MKDSLKINSNFYYSPLRYPGGKTSLFDFLARTLETNEINYGVYAEAFAGGAGAALKLLMLEYVGDIYLNDKDESIYKFWHCVLNETEELCRMIRDAALSVEYWRKRRGILLGTNQRRFSDLDIGFSAFYLNRCNRSGILTAGPIGGIGQNGKWKIDARFNKSDLIKRIEKIALYKERIHISNKDAVSFLRFLKMKDFRQDEILVYLDPPYVQQGKELYQHYFKEKDHRRVAHYLQREMDYHWIVSYDDHQLIHSIYKEVTKNIFEFNYYANQTKIGQELVISSKQCQLPELYQHYSRLKQIEPKNPESIAI